MNHYMHLCGSTVINANRIRSVVNLTLGAHIMYLLYTVCVEISAVCNFCGFHGHLQIQQKFNL